MSQSNWTDDNFIDSIQEWEVWARIQYLDSPTDYREYLPPMADVRPRMIPDSFVLLDGGYRLRDSSLLMLILVTNVLITSGCLLYLVVHAF